MMYRTLVFHRLFSRGLRKRHCSVADQGCMGRLAESERL
jgi:hypothetical protein